MTRPPTAEEVLKCYLDMVSAGDLFKRTTTRQSERFHMWSEATSKFKDSLEQWDAAQGPVTREWFVERFGVPHPGIEIVFDRENGPELVCRKCGRWIRLVNPTRAKIEALVEMLGGECNGKDA